jgi:hypothetical protein
MNNAIKKYLGSRNINLLRRMLPYVKDPIQRSEIKSHIIVYKIENDQKIDKFYNTMSTNKIGIKYNMIAAAISPVCIPIEFVSCSLFVGDYPYPLGIVCPLIVSYNAARFVQRIAFIGYSDIRLDYLHATNQELEKIKNQL